MSIKSCAKRRKKLELGIKKGAIFFCLLPSYFLLSSCAGGHADTNPSPPPLKPYTLEWDANPAGDNVKLYNVYTVNAGGLHTFVISIAAPATSYVVPPSVPAGTSFVVTASNGSAESGYSDPPATMPAAPGAPQNVVIKSP
jgi:hypothetical protein